MTHRAAGSFRGVPRIWILPLLVITGVLAAIALDIFSRALILDVVAWWPVWLALILLVALAGGRRIGKLRVSGVVSIIVTVALVVFVVGHVREWPLNPSASRYLAGPSPGELSEASLVAAVDGNIVVSAGSDFLYEVDPLPEGGDVGLPTAVERTIEDSAAVQLSEPADSGFDRSSGWNIRLSTAPRWALVLGGIIDADLTALRLAELELEGGGDVALGPVDGPTRIVVDGGFAFAVPAGVAARVEGSAQVPGSWEAVPGGWRSPADGLGWVITVPEGSVVSIEER